MSNAVFTFGRFNPPTMGHMVLLNKVKAEAKKRNADAYISTGQSEDSKRNPLNYKTKQKYMKKAFKGVNVINDTTVKNMFDVLDHLKEKGTEQVTMVVGSDRLREFKQLLKRYGSEYGFTKIEVISAGERDPDASGAKGMSASKMRDAAKRGDYQAWLLGCPETLSKNDCMKMFKDTQKAMGVKEHIGESWFNFEEFEEFVELMNERQISMDTRRKMQRTARRTASRRAKARKRKAKFKKSPEQLKVKADKEAKMMMRTKLSGGDSWGKMRLTQRAKIDKLLQKKSGKIKKMAKKLLPQVRRQEMERLKKLRSGTPGETKEDVQLLREPEIYDRLVSQLKAKGQSNDAAHAIASSQLQKHGILKPGTKELTAKGEKRNSMSPAERAKDRAANKDGKSPKDYKYNSKTNIATQKEETMFNESDEKPLIRWMDTLEKQLKKMGSSYKHVKPTDALELYYKGVDPRKAAKQLKESIELDESQRFGGKVNIPASKETTKYIENATRSQILIDVPSALHPSARFLVIKNPNASRSQDKVLMAITSDPKRRPMKMFSFFGTHVSHQKAMDFAKKHKLVAMKDKDGNPLYAKESVELEEQTKEFYNEVHAELKKVMDSKYYREFRASNGGRALENVINHMGKSRGWRVDKTVKSIIGKYGKNRDEYIKLSFQSAAKGRMTEEVELDEVKISRDPQLRIGLGKGRPAGQRPAKIEKTKFGFQVMVYSPKTKKYIAQGSPHKTKAAAEKDAKSFNESVELGEKVERTFKFATDMQAKQFEYDISNSGLAVGDRVGNKVTIKTGLERKIAQAIAKYLKKNKGKMIKESVELDEAGDPRIAKLSFKAKEILAMMANSLDTTGGPYLDKRNVKFLTRRGVENTLKAAQRIPKGNKDAWKDIALVKKELGESVELDEAKTFTLVAKKGKKTIETIKKVTQKELKTVEMLLKTAHGKNVNVEKIAESIEENSEKFEPHMMYDPKTGKGYKANTYQDHLRMDKMGYTHEKPDVKEKMSNAVMKALGIEDPLKGRGYPYQESSDKKKLNTESVEEDYAKAEDRRKYHGSAKQRARRSARTNTRNKANRAGRTSVGDGKDIDHKDGNPLNNSPSNLRVVSKKFNRGRDNNKWRETKEEHGAGEEGTSKLVNTYKKETPGEAGKEKSSFAKVMNTLNKKKAKNADTSY